MQQTGASAGADVGARLAIRLLQDAAESGELDPWDVDVIAVIDGFLDQLSQRINVPKQVAAAIAGRGGSYERDLADSSEAFLAASVLVGLKAELLEASILPPAAEIEEGFDAEFDEQGWLDPAFDLPRRPERHLQRPVAPPPTAAGHPWRADRTAGIDRGATGIDELQQKRRQRQKRYSDREAIAQVSSLAHREKLPETTAALGVFLNGWEDALNWLDFEALVDRWREAAAADLDTDRVGVFWALLFLSSQGRVELEQVGWLHAPIRLRRLPAAGSVTQLPISNLDVPASLPTSDPVAA